MCVDSCDFPQYKARKCGKFTRGRDDTCIKYFDIRACIIFICIYTVNVVNKAKRKQTCVLAVYSSTQEANKIYTEYDIEYGIGHITYLYRIGIHAENTI